MVIGTQKGRETKENILRNFGSAHPEGYRKALRLMKMADKFGLPIVTLIDTAGAYPGIGSEERHIGEAIAVNLREMMLLEVPILAAAYYSVISPEGCAAILWKDRAAAPKAAAALRITAADLAELGLVDEVVREPEGGAHQDPAATATNLRDALLKHLHEVRALRPEERLSRRYAKFRALGTVQQPTAAPTTAAA